MGNGTSRIRIQPELIEALHQYAEARGYTLSEGLNELIRIGLASSPTDAVIDSAKKKAYRDAHDYAIRRINSALEEIQADMERTFGFVTPTRRKVNGG